MIAAVTSGLFNNSRKSPVTKSAWHLAPTSLARSGLRSTTPIQSTCGCRAATSPRKSPTRPAPTMARPMRLGCFLKRLPERKRDHFVALGRKVGGHVDLHHHARVLGRDHHWPVVDHRFEEMDR